MRAVIVAAAFGLAACSGQPAEEAKRPSAQSPETTVPAVPAVKLDAKELAGGFLVAVAPASLPATEYEALARDACGSRSFCKVGIWTDGALLPRGFPMTDREVGGQVFMYSVNRDTGFEQSLWNCNVVPQADPAACGLGTN